MYVNKTLSLGKIVHWLIDDEGFLIMNKNVINNGVMSLNE
jgi:hypothetical protein